METSAKYRHELKYVVSQAQIAQLTGRIQGLIARDPHTGPDGRYRIRSLYFDTPDNRCLWENISGSDPREKFRIRIYNHSARRITLECKRKERGKTLKTACPLTEAQTCILMEGRPLSDSEDHPPLLRKLNLLMRMQGLAPAVIVEYDRIPYICRNGNVRITFDTDICSSDAVGAFLDENLPRRPVMPMGTHLLEVKYDEYLPDVIYHSLNIDGLRQTAFSKYAICRKFHR